MVQRRHKSTCSNDLPRVLVHHGPITVKWLIELGQLFVAPNRPLQPALTLGACLGLLAAHISSQEIDIENLVNGIQILHGKRSNQQAFSF